MSFFDNLKRPLKQVLTLSNCSFCGVAQSVTGICGPCLEAIAISGHQCSRCASPFDTNHSSPNETTSSKLNSSQGSVNTPDSPSIPATVECGDCIKRPPLYNRLITATHYQFPVDKALSELKFNHQLHYARSLSFLLEQTLRQHYTNTEFPQALIAIPLHPKRLGERGFNQSDLIAKQLEKNLKVRRINALTRIKDTPHQIGLSEKQRRKNLHKAFAVQDQLPEHIALVDDVVTTGSTVNEAAKQCLKHGAKKVDVWCLAKT